MRTLADWTAAFHANVVEPAPMIVPTWMWDGLERQGDALFFRLRDSGKIVRNQSR